MITHNNHELTLAQKEVLYEKVTEPPFSGLLLHTTDDGTYHCANCGAVLFESDAKFDSGSGWPSFDSARAEAIIEKADSSLGMNRTEVICARCGGHLGHLFGDGPAETTGLRYCINSIALNFSKSKD